MFHAQPRSLQPSGFGLFLDEVAIGPAFGVLWTNLSAFWPSCNYHGVVRFMMDGCLQCGEVEDAAVTRARRTVVEGVSERGRVPWYYGQFVWSSAYGISA